MRSGLYTLSRIGKDVRDRGPTERGSDNINALHQIGSRSEEIDAGLNVLPRTAAHDPGNGRHDIISCVVSVPSPVFRLHHLFRHRHSSEVLDCL